MIILKSEKEIETMREAGRIVAGAFKLVEKNIKPGITTHKAFYMGYCGDAARTYPVGNISSEAAKLIQTTRESFFEGLKYARLGFRLSDISHAIQSYVEGRGFSVVKSFVGHGIGQHMHEDPQVPNFGSPGKGPRLRPGMALAIEPMVNLGTDQVDTLKDGWTVVTRDRRLSAHYENTIAITDGDPIILTLEGSE